MIAFLFKGLWRDRQRSLLPVIVVVIGVFLTVFLQCLMSGVLGDLVDFNARFSTGHVKVTTRSFAERVDQMPNDLALSNTAGLIGELNAEYPDLEWIQRIRFGGLIDAPDENGETRSQGPAIGWGIDLLSPGSREAERMSIPKSIVAGRLPERPGEVLLSEQFANKLKVVPGDRITLVGSTMYGSMSVYNFRVAGTVRFGTSVIDRGAIIADLRDVQVALDMQDAASEVLGYFRTGVFNKEAAASVVAGFMEKSKPDNPFTPVMLSLRDQNGLSSMVDYMDVVSALFVGIFVLAMSLVLWNAGLLGGLRRYGEVGVRLAVGETKGHVYRSMISESVFVGIIGSVIGSAGALSLAWWMQKNGLDVSSFMENASMMLPSVYRAEISPTSFYIGFIPGLLATVLGTSLSGIGIYKRNTAQLFKELE
jgi:putative ABC transport system permease protein